MTPSAESTRSGLCGGIHQAFAVEAARKWWDSGSRSPCERDPIHGRFRQMDLASRGVSAPELYASWIQFTAPGRVEPLPRPRPGSPDRPGGVVPRRRAPPAGRPRSQPVSCRGATAEAVAVTDAAQDAAAARNQTGARFLAHSDANPGRTKLGGRKDQTDRTVGVLGLPQTHAPDPALRSPAPLRRCSGAPRGAVRPGQRPSIGCRNSRRSIGRAFRPSERSTPMLPSSPSGGTRAPRIRGPGEVTRDTVEQKNVQKENLRLQAARMVGYYTSY